MTTHKYKKQKQNVAVLLSTTLLVSLLGFGVNWSLVIDANFVRTFDENSIEVELDSDSAPEETIVTDEVTTPELETLPSPELIEDTEVPVEENDDTIKEDVTPIDELPAPISQPINGISEVSVSEKRIDGASAIEISILPTTQDSPEGIVEEFLNTQTPDSNNVEKVASALVVQDTLAPLSQRQLDNALGQQSIIGAVAGLFNSGEEVEIFSATIKDGDKVILETNEFGINNSSGQFSLDFPATLPTGSYTLEFEYLNPFSGEATVVEEEFIWGVLLLNSNQHIYLPGTDAEIAYGVLDSAGMPVCGADITTTLMSPSGDLQSAEVFEGETCELFDSQNIAPDYSSQVTLQEVGQYVISTTTIIDGAEHNYITSLTVEPDPDFIITRSAATRLYPDGFAPMNVEVEFFDSYSGSITDTVPSDFVVNGDLEINGSWAPGDTAELSYEFDAPDASPDVHRIGPLSIDGNSEFVWSLANDQVFSNTITTNTQGGVDGNSANYQHDIIVDTNDFPAGSVITDVNLVTTFDKTDFGTSSNEAAQCWTSSYAGGAVYNNEIRIFLTNPGGTITEPVAVNGAYSGNAYGGIVTVTWDEDSGATTSGTPVSGTFNPAGNFNNFNGGNLYGTWRVTYDDTANQDPFCLQSASLEIEVNAPGVSIGESGGTTVISQEGLTDTFDVELDKQPTSDVVLDVTPADNQIGLNGAGAGTPIQLTFTPTNWNTPQTVTILAIDDTISETPPYSSLITTTIDTALTQDADYDMINPADIPTVNATITGDNDTPEVILSGETGKVVTEDGVSDSYTAVLDTQPSDDVTITLDPSTQLDLGNGSGNTIDLIFTPTNWNVSQTVTINATDDLVIEGGHTGDIFHTVTSSDGGYNGYIIADISVGITDNDILVGEFTQSATSQNEDTAFNHILVVSGGILTAPATIDIIDLGTGSATSGSDYTFITPRTITVGAGDYTSANFIGTGSLGVTTDSIQENNETINFELQSTNANFVVGDANNDTTINSQFTHTIINDDTADIIAIQSDGSNDAVEGDSDTIDISLATEPADDVIVQIIPDSQVDVGGGAGVTQSITFTSANWNVNQTVTLTAVDDQVVEGSHTGTINFSVTSVDPFYNGIALSNQTLNITDNDTAGFTLSTNALTIDEDGGSGVFTVVLDSAPMGNVVLDISSSNTSEVTVSPSLLTFTPADWDTPQSITATGVDDDAVLVTAEIITVSVNSSSDAAFIGSADDTVAVTVTEDDVAGVVVTPIDTNLSEPSGDNGSFSLVLTSEPTADVTIALSSNDVTEGTVQSSATFTSANWDIPQTIPVIVVDDVLGDGAITFQIITGDVTSSDGNYVALGGGDVDDVTMVTANDDPPGVEVNIVDSITGEDGDTATVQIRLLSQPSVGDVTIPLSVTDSSEGSISVSTVVIPSTDWNLYQNVVITGVDDSIDDGDQGYTLVVGDPTSPDSVYNDLDDSDTADVSLTNIDDDQVGVTIETITPVDISEGGSSDSYTVRLDSEPTDDVDIVLSADPQFEFFPSGTSSITLTFTPSDWNVNQIVGVVAVDDQIDEPFMVRQVTYSTTSIDPLYNSFAITPTNVEITDNDAAGITITESGGDTSTTEGATNDTLEFVLDCEPTDTVTVTISTDSQTSLGLGGGVDRVLTFTPSNWDTTQTITISAVDDVVVEGPHSSLISTSAASNDVFYDGLTASDITNSITDNDSAGFSINTNSINTPENGTSSFQVWLDGQPQSNVVFTVFSDDTGEATLTPATLTFTPANWNTPQTVTVTGVDDLIDRNDSTFVTLQVDGANSDDAFDFVSDQVVLVTILDDDTAGFTVIPNSFNLQEDDILPTPLSVVLDSEPESDVVIDLALSNNETVTLSGNSLTFTPSNWDTPQTIDINPIDDPDAYDEAATITFSINDAGSDDSYDPVSDQVVGVSVADEETPGVNLTTSLTISENSSDTLDIVLTTAIDSDVVIDISSSDTGAAIVSPNTVTFTSGDWNTPQQITITGTADSDLLEEMVVVSASVNDVLSDDGYDLVADQSSDITVLDSDNADVIVTPSGFIINEAGGSDTFSVVLSNQPQSDVVIDLTSNDVGEATVSPSQLTFTPSNWDTPQIVTVTGVDDNIDRDDTATINFSVNDAASDDSYDGVNDEQYSVQLTNDDTADIIVDESDGSTLIGEDGTSDTFSLVLGSEPTDNVVITVTPDAQIDLGNGAGVDEVITFLPTNYTTPQTITVNAVDDSVVEGAHNGTLSFSVSSLDGKYNNFALADINASITDNDTADFIVSPLTLTIDEDGGTGSFDVVLSNEPLSDVTLTIFRNSSSEATVSTNSLTFTQANWDTPQTITVTGIDDDFDRDDSMTVSVSVDDVNSDDAFDPLPNKVINVTLTDDDTFGVLVGPISGNTGEDGTTATFTVNLLSEPLGDVTIALSSSDTTEGVLPSTLVFPAANWATTATVAVTGIDDFIDDGDISYSIIIGDVTSLDPQYDGLGAGDLPDLTLDNHDDDTAGFTITESGGSTEVTEGGASDTLTYVLNSQPTEDVTLILGTDDELDLGFGRNAPFSVFFTPSNWDTPQTVTLNAFDDPIQEDLHSGVLNATTTSFDPNYEGLSQNTNVTITDNDVSAVTRTESGGATNVAEGGSTATIDFVLTTDPSGPVTVTLSPNSQLNLGSGAGTDVDLVFTSGDWADVQSVTVTADDDNLIERIHTGLITYTISSTDNNYDILTLSDTTVNITDNDNAGFTIANLASEQITEGTSSTEYTVVLDSEPTSDVVIELTSNNTNALSIDNPTVLTFSPANWDTPQPVTLTAVEDDNVVDETVSISFVINDALSDDDFDSVASQSKAPSTIDNDTAGIILTNSVSVFEPGGSNTFSIELSNQPTSDVVITFVSDDTGEATVAPSSITFTPTNWNSPVSIVVTGVDDNVIATDTATITVAIDDVNSDDDWDGVADELVTVSIVEDDAAGFVVSEVDNLTDETGDTGSFSIVLTSIPTDDVTIPLSVSDGTEGSVPSSITITPANWNTPNVVTVTGVDDNIFDGSVRYEVITGDPTSLDPAYDTLVDTDIVNINMENQDDDPPGVIVSVVESESSEDGTEAIVQFSLVSQIANNDDITIPLSLSDNSEATLNGVTSITIANSDWNNPAANEVLITGLDDSVADGDVFYSLITGDPVTVDTLYGILTASDIADPLLQNIDNDTPGIEVVETSSSTNANEGGSGDMVAVSLTSEPLDDVVITLNPDAQVELFDINDLPVTSLTFTSGNWDTPQDLKIEAIDDNVAEGMHSGVISFNAASADTLYDGIAISIVNVAITDNDTPGVMISETGLDTTVFEGGGGDSYEVYLTSEPTSDVTITIAPDGQSDLGNGSGGSIDLIFTPINWATPQIVSVAATDDSFDEGGHTSNITHSSASVDVNYNGILITDVIVTIGDNDISGVSRFDNLTILVSENGLQDSYSLVLDTEPIGDVTITITPDSELDLGNGFGATVDIVFTSINWDTPHTVSVSTLDDDFAEGTELLNLTYSVASSDTNYDGLVLSGDQVEAIDNDNAGIMFSPTTGRTRESGSVDTMEVTLFSQTTSDVTIFFSVSDSTEGSIPASLTITPANWNNGAANTIDVTGVDDTLLDGNITYQVITDDVVSLDPMYDVFDGPSMVDITYVNEDNDVDTDGDLVSDSQEALDGTLPSDAADFLDSDGDRVPDVVEIDQGSDPFDSNDFIDTDNGGTPDYVEQVLFPSYGLTATSPAIDSDDLQDSDGDKVPDYIEIIQGTDPQDSLDYLDTDGDGVPDYIEGLEGSDANDVNDYLDTDGDLVPDYVEDCVDGTDLNDALDYIDGDGDLVPDYVEIYIDSSDENDGTDFVDTDSGGVANYIELIYLPNAGYGALDPNNGGDDTTDSDGDGVPDGVEVVDGSDPTDDTSYEDIDGDLVPDYVEGIEGSNPNITTDYLDTDGDLVPDYIEVIQGTDPSNPLDYVDTDGDLVPDYVEIILDSTDETDSFDVIDSDGGSVPDYVEDVLLPNAGLPATDPNNSGDDLLDSDGDGVPNIVEYLDGTDFSDSTSYIDTDSDLVPDYVEGLDGSDPGDKNSYADIDSDSVPDYVEIRDGSDQFDALDYIDSDGDLVPDFVEVVCDGTDPLDGLDYLDNDSGSVADYIESVYFVNVLLPATDINNSGDDLLDSDGDGVPNIVEIVDGSDPLDDTSYDDTDGDLVPDYIENIDGTSLSNPLDYIDTDGDLVPDYVENRDGSDSSDSSSYVDTDGGSVSDYVETYILPLVGLPATDINNIADDLTDSDGDGVPDGIEVIQGTDPNDNDSYQDSDGDLVPDFVEQVEGSNPNDNMDYVDTDGDLVPDYIENIDGTDGSDALDYIDSDLGGLPDYVENVFLPNYGQPATDPNNPLDDMIDSDGDLVPDVRELIDGSDLGDKFDYLDSDGDGVPDFIETMMDGTGENDSSDYVDTDGDLVPDYIEDCLGSDRNDPLDYIDSDGDLVPDYVEMRDGTDESDALDFVDSDSGSVPDYVEQYYIPAMGEPALDINNPIDDLGDSDGDSVPDYEELRNDSDMGNADDDGDGVPTIIEYGAPNGGDSNDDGILDYNQDNVAVNINPATEEYITLESSGCEIISGFEAVTEASFGVDDLNADYLVGLHGFELGCGAIGDTANLKVIWDQEYDTSAWVYKKFNPTTEEYFFIDDIVELSVEEFGGVRKTVSRYSVVDGSFLDSDGELDGFISDPAGPALMMIEEEEGGLLRTGGYSIVISLLGVMMVLLGGSALTYTLKKQKILK